MIYISLSIHISVPHLTLFTRRLYTAVLEVAELAEYI